MKSFASLVLLVVLSLVPLRALAAPEPVAAKVYVGEGGIEVTVVQLKEPDKFLIQVTGSRSSFDGLVLPYKVDSTGLVYTTSWRGAGYSFLVGDTGRGTTTYKVHAPSDVRVGRPVTYNEARTKLVKLGELVARHEKQQKDGTLDRFARFNRADEEAANDQDLAEATKSFHEDCQTNVPVAIAWSGIDDQLLKSISISGYCSSPVAAMQWLCRKSPAARAEIQAKVKKVTCQFGKEQKAELDAQGTLLWMTYKGAANGEEVAKKYWEGYPVAGPYGQAPDKDNGELPYWGQLKTLGERILLEDASVCSDGKSAFVLSSPGENNWRSLYYGDGKTFARIPRPNLFVQDYFLDPRQWNPEANSNARGNDMRRYSSVRFNTDKKTCTVQCGTRKTELKLLDAKATAELLRGAKFTGPLQKRQPHVLTRDDQGVYYYVDRGVRPDTQNNFKLYIGARGSLKPKAMTNVVADSQGEIFTTKSGALRLIIGPGGKESSWVSGKKVTKLTPIPVEQNLNVIYNDLGVYTGQRLGTPCDDL
jgi:hypothetical protein